MRHRPEGDLKKKRNMRNVKWSLSAYVLVLLSAATGASGATFTVKNLAHSGADSLRQAILDATGGSDTIVFQAGLTGTIKLTSGQLTLTSSVTITAPGASALTVSGNNASRVVQVNSGVTATLSGLTIADAGGSDGGGVFSNGTLTLSACTIQSNLPNSRGNRS
jgi:hypothetical protein